MKHIVIVGGSYSGVGTAHRILKQASKSSQVRPFKIILVSRDSHFYWNLAAPRAVILGQFHDDNIFRSVAEGFAQYPKDRFEFVLGSATGVDTDAKTLRVEEADGTTKELDYDYLILSTGARTQADTPFKSRGSTEATKTALYEMQEKISKSKTIVLAGAGPTGVETAGEIVAEHGWRKTVILLSQAPVVLPGRPASVSRTAEKQLRSIGVNLKLKTKVANQKDLPDGSQELTLEDGKKIVSDLYIPTFGVVPNTSFLPAQLLNSAGFVKVDGQLEVKGVKDVFAIGEVSDAEIAQWFYIEKQAVHMAKSIMEMLGGNPPLPYKASSTSIGGVQIGRKAGTGNFGSFKMPTFMVVAMRKTLFLDKFTAMIDGSGL